MIRTTPAVLLAAALAAPALAQAPLGPIVNPDTGSRFYRLAPTTWANALTQAAAMNGRLAVIPDAATNTWIRANVAAAGGNTTDCFIGLNDAASEGSYRWTNGDPVTWLNWAPGEPNNFGGNEDFGVMQPSSGFWNDIPVGFNRPAIVEVTGAIRVPQEYPSIQAAINAAIDGQTILVAPGTYTGSFDFQYKKLVIKSEAGAAATTIRTTNTANGIICGGGQGPESALEGFTIVPDTATTWLLYLDSRVSVRGCRIGGANNYAIYTTFSPTISDCVLVGNGFGGLLAQALYQPTAVTVQNCTIAGNGIGGVVIDGPHAQWSAVVNMTNSVVRSNAQSIEIIGVGAAHAAYSNIQGGAAGAGNIDADPRFAGAPGPNGRFDATDDYSLLPGSPCIDAGDNSARVALASVSAPLDAAGNARFADDPSTSDAGRGPGAVVDMGALEFTGASCLIDFNHDGFVDFFDYDDFVAAFESGC